MKFNIVKEENYNFFVFVHKFSCKLKFIWLDSFKFALLYLGIYYVNINDQRIAISMQFISFESFPHYKKMLIAMF